MCVHMCAYMCMLHIMVCVMVYSMLSSLQPSHAVDVQYMSSVHMLVVDLHVGTHTTVHAVCDVSSWPLL